MGPKPTQQIIQKLPGKNNKFIRVAISGSAPAVIFDGIAFSAAGVEVISVCLCAQIADVGQGGDGSHVVAAGTGPIALAMPKRQSAESWFTSASCRSLSTMERRS
jgi:hypothetical protein